MKSATYRPFCFFCRRRIVPDRPQGYRVLVECRDGSSEIKPQWDESHCRTDSTETERKIYGHIVLPENETAEGIEASQLHRLPQSEVVHLIDTKCKGLLNRARNGGLAFDTILNALIPSMPLKEMEHTDGSLFSDLDTVMFPITSIRSSRLEVFLKPASQTMIFQVMKRLPQELITLLLSFIPESLSYWIAFHLGESVIMRRDVQRCVVRDNLEVIEALLKLWKDKTALSDKLNTTGDWIENVIIGSCIEATFIDIHGTKYLHRLSKVDHDRCSSDERFHRYDIALVDCQAIIYQVAEFGIINLAFGLDGTGQPDWILKSRSTNYNLCYNRCVGSLNQVRVKGNASLMIS